MGYVAIADRDHEIEHHDPQTFISKYVWSQDHKVIAIQYSCTAIFVGVIALCLSAMMRLQLGFPDSFSFINPENYYQFVTMHGMIMVIYLLTALFLGGFGNYLIPLMIGSRDMVFPYLNMLSYWVYLLSVIILLISFFVPGGATGAGWTLYPPQAIMPGTPGTEWGIVLMLASLGVFIVAFTMGGLNYITTVLQARCRGMTLMRMPLSVWGIFIATILGLLAFPALLVSAIMMLFDKTLHTSFFMPAISSAGVDPGYSGGSPILFQHLFWFFGHPEVYIVALPAFGIVSDLLSTHARKNIFGYRMMVWAIIAIGGLSFIVWAHHMYVSGMNPYFGFFFATTTLIIAVPTAIKVYNWVLTLWEGNIHLRVPMLFSIGCCSSVTSRSICRYPIPISWSLISIWLWVYRRFSSSLALSITGGPKSRARCTTRRSASGISGRHSSALMRFIYRCITWASRACRDATSQWAIPISCRPRLKTLTLRLRYRHYLSRRHSYSSLLT
jgi:cytochrome c oxidase subunit 1